MVALFRISEQEIKQSGAIRTTELAKGRYRAQLVRSPQITINEI